MAQRMTASSKQLKPDPRYHSILASKFVNCLMSSGKKTVAQRVFYGALDIIAEKLKKEPLEVFTEALNNVKPTVEVRSRRVGGATYQVPTEVRNKRQQALAIRWLIIALRARGEKTTRQRLAGEIMDAAAGRGNAIKKREDTHRMAEANKAFSHYRW